MCTALWSTCRRSSSIPEWAPRRRSSRGGAGPHRLHVSVSVWVRGHWYRGHGGALRSLPLGFWQRPPLPCARGYEGCCHSSCARRRAPWAPQSGTACDRNPPPLPVFGATHSCVCRRKCTTVHVFGCTRDIFRGRGGVRTSVFSPCVGLARLPTRSGCVHKVRAPQL
jgi:hypothetical protein